MEQEKSLTGQESFDVINRMIRTAQNDIKDDSFYYLIWGWLVLIASTVNYFLMQIDYENSYLPWAILMPLGGVATGIYSYKHERKQKVRSYIDDVMKYVVIAFVVSLFIVLFSQAKLGLSTYPMVMLTYGTWLFISGGAVKFQPLIIGGIINWILGIAAFYVGFEIQLLLIASAVLLGYIIPGYMLKSKFKKQNELSHIS
ncbi:MAG TPA: hypothetical protein PKD91_03870 [Bacteroidia bacterium]|nr:hypothetical protein [Bacteroidia bacterium]